MRTKMRRRTEVESNQMTASLASKSAQARCRHCLLPSMRLCLTHKLREPFDWLVPNKRSCKHRKTLKRRAGIPHAFIDAASKESAVAACAPAACASAAGLERPDDEPSSAGRAPTSCVLLLLREGSPRRRSSRASSSDDAA